MTSTNKPRKKEKHIMLIQKASMPPRSKPITLIFFSETLALRYRLKSLISACFICAWVLLITFNANAAPPPFVNQDLTAQSPEDDPPLEKSHATKRNEKEEWGLDALLSCPVQVFPQKPLPAF